MPRHETCPTCNRTPVSGKTWSLLMEQDKVLGRQRAQILETKERCAFLEEKCEFDERARVQAVLDLAIAQLRIQELEGGK